ncbi:MAG TPA: hypothetical protein DEV81_05915 [Cyanobacteria bacterium UBA11049]|nr:hypothetical protein [Cyanobacteria bacterium UBA11049]
MFTYKSQLNLSRLSSSHYQILTADTATTFETERVEITLEFLSEQYGITTDFLLFAQAAI